MRAGGQTLLVDCGRGVLQRATAVGVGANALTALLLTHLHSDHIADLGDVLIAAGSPHSHPTHHRCRSSAPGAEGRRRDAQGVRPGHRLPHRPPRRPDRAPAVDVQEHIEGLAWDRDGVRIARGPHRSSAGGTVELDSGSLPTTFRWCWAADTVPCASLDELAAGADALFTP